MEDANFRAIFGFFSYSRCRIEQLWFSAMACSIHFSILQGWKLHFSQCSSQLPNLPFHEQPLCLHLACKSLITPSMGLSLCAVLRLKRSRHTGQVFSLCIQVPMQASQKLWPQYSRKGTVKRLVQMGQRRCVEMASRSTRRKSSAASI